MKKIATIILILAASLTSAQPCKTVKPGMTKPELIRHAGQPDSLTVIAVSVANDTVSLWHYGNQQVGFNGKTVDEVIVDAKKETALAIEMGQGKISKEEFKARLEKIKSEACK